MRMSEILMCNIYLSTVSSIYGGSIFHVRHSESNSKALERAEKQKRRSDFVDKIISNFKVNRTFNCFALFVDRFFRESKLISSQKHQLTLLFDINESSYSLECRLHHEQVHLKKHTRWHRIRLCRLIHFIRETEQQKSLL